MQIIGGGGARPPPRAPLFLRACTHIRKLRPVHKLGQLSEVHKFACVHLNIKPNQLPNGALYRIMMQVGIKLSTKHLSKANNKIFKILV